MPDAPLSVVIEDDDNSVRTDPATGTIEIDQPDGGVVVQLGNGPLAGDDEGDDGFYANLVGRIGAERLARIGEELHEAITADDSSRQEHLQMRARGLDLLGLKLREPKATAGDSGSAMEGVATVTNPLLLETVLRGWANAQAELLPANGPVKVRDDGQETASEDDLGEALERGFNHYLTKVATEYYPDTSHMLLWGTYFGGSGFKKVYRCPLRRRVVSESVDEQHLIVSDTTKDLASCGRVTHEIPMRPSVMKRMMLAGAYRDTDLGQPTPQPNVVDEKVAGMQGTSLARQRPEDQDYTLWESQCELDLDEFAPPAFRGKGIPLPYIVTLDKDTHVVLAIRRDWREDDEDARRKRMYVRYPYVIGPGFYCTGMLNIVGNASAAMTAAWREALDAGMFANFPGGLMSKQGARQNSNVFRVGPGEFATIDTGGLPIQQAVMEMPYRDVTPGLLNLMDRVTAQAEKVGGTADIPTAEGIQNVPVGTMLAQIEQATKIMGAAHKGLHQAQSEEFELMLDLFREYPEDFIGGDDTAPSGYWTTEKFLQALDDVNLVPCSDPNVPSHIHRVAKAIALYQIRQDPDFRQLMDPLETLKRILSAIREDPNGLIKPPMPQAQPADLAGQAKVMDSQTKAQKVNVDAAKAATEAQSRQQEVEGEKQIALTKLATELVIHRADAAREQANADRDHSLALRQHGLDVAAHGLDAAQAQHDAEMDVGQLLNQQPPEPAA